jgi:hypothetical protein
VGEEHRDDPSDDHSRHMIVIVPYTTLSTTTGPKALLIATQETLPYPPWAA